VIRCTHCEATEGPFVPLGQVVRERSSGAPYVVSFYGCEDCIEAKGHRVPVWAAAREERER
jgi:hypothetical protein